LGVLLGEFILSQRKASGKLTPENYVVSTLVTTRMLRRVTQALGARCLDENQVGFKWICSVMDQEDPSQFVFGTEESHGYLVGEYCRDKDGAIACMLMSELAAWVKSQGKSLHEHMDSLYRKYGYHQERLINIRMEGSDGMKRMEKLMEKFRNDPPKTLGGIEVESIRDYSTGKRLYPDGRAEDITGQQGNIVMFDTTEPGNYIAARPSGTEPKVKFYMFGYVPADKVEDLDALKKSLAQRMDAYAVDMQAIADSV
jgi:phosphoglucomutase/phosphomannomutase